MEWRFKNEDKWAVAPLGRTAQLHRRWDGVGSTLFFFFSSRRRHTRCSRDWSSDVCSSDLVTNTGARTGDEVVQLYVQHLGSAVERPNKDLRGYRRITLNAGETRTVELSLRASSLAYWNPATHGWVVETEPVRIQVGTSSADLRLDTRIRVVGAR